MRARPSHLPNYNAPWYSPEPVDWCKVVDAVGHRRC
jgi:hypothetical protein